MLPALWVTGSMVFRGRENLEQPGRMQGVRELREEMPTAEHSACYEAQNPFIFPSPEPTGVKSYGIDVILGMKAKLQKSTNETSNFVFSFITVLKTHLLYQPSSQYF